MARTLLVVDNLSDWAPYYPSGQLITFEDYLATELIASDQRVRVINLCRSYCYLSDGYYCSLLAEARGFLRTILAPDFFAEVIQGCRKMGFGGFI